MLAQEASCSCGLLSPWTFSLAGMVEKSTFPNANANDGSGGLIGTVIGIAGTVIHIALLLLVFRVLLADRLTTAL